MEVQFVLRFALFQVQIALWFAPFQVQIALGFAPFQVQIALAICTFWSADCTCHLRFKSLICTNKPVKLQKSEDSGANQDFKVQMASAICTWNGANGKCNLHLHLEWCKSKCNLHLEWCKSKWKLHLDLHHPSANWGANTVKNALRGFFLTSKWCFWGGGCWSFWGGWTGRFWGGSMPRFEGVCRPGIEGASYQRLRVVGLLAAVVREQILVCCQRNMIAESLCEIPVLFHKLWVLFCLTFLSVKKALHFCLVWPGWSNWLKLTETDWNWLKLAETGCKLAKAFNRMREIRLNLTKVD